MVPIDFRNPSKLKTDQDFSGLWYHLNTKLNKKINLFVSTDMIIIQIQCEDMPWPNKKFSQKFVWNVLFFLM